jgi:hypothetical protein
MSDRVVDEMNPNAQFKTKDVSSFLVLQHDHLDKLPFITWDMNPEKYSDPALKNLLHKVGHKLTQVDSLFISIIYVGNWQIRVAYTNLFDNFRNLSSTNLC